MRVVITHVNSVIRQQYYKMARISVVIVIAAVISFLPGNAKAYKRVVRRYGEPAGYRTVLRSDPVGYQSTYGSGYDGYGAADYAGSYTPSAAYDSYYGPGSRTGSTLYQTAPAQKTVYVKKKVGVVGDASGGLYGSGGYGSGYGYRPGAVKYVQKKIVGGAGIYGSGYGGKNFFDTFLSD